MKASKHSGPFYRICPCSQPEHFLPSSQSPAGPGPPTGHRLGKIKAAALRAALRRSHDQPIRLTWISAGSGDSLPGRRDSLHGNARRLGEMRALSGALGSMLIQIQGGRMTRAASSWAAKARYIKNIIKLRQIHLTTAEEHIALSPKKEAGGFGLF